MQSQGHESDTLKCTKILAEYYLQNVDEMVKSQVDTRNSIH